MLIEYSDPHTQLRTRRLHSATIIEPYQATVQQSLYPNQQFWYECDAEIEPAHWCGSLPHQLVAADMLKPPQCWGICPSVAIRDRNRQLHPAYKWRAGRMYPVMDEAIRRGQFVPGVVYFTGSNQAASVSEAFNIVQRLNTPLALPLLFVWDVLIGDHAQANSLVSYIRDAVRNHPTLFADGWRVDWDNRLVYTEPSAVAGQPQPRIHVTHYFYKDSTHAHVKT